MAILNREALPRYKPPKHDFNTFRARSMNAFAKASSDGILRKIAAAQGLTIEEGLTTLEQSYPVPVPSGGMREAQNPRRFDRMSERTIRGGTLPWQGGISEEVKKLTRPGPVATLWGMPNKAEKFGASCAGVVDKLIVDRLSGGTTGQHGYDDAAFFGANKKINPDDPNSSEYTNNYVEAVNRLEIVEWIRVVKRRLKKIPHPMSTAKAPMWIDQMLGAIMVSTDNFDMFEDIAKRDDEIVVVKNGADIVAATTRVNRERGQFLVIESKNLVDEEVFAFAAGLGAEPAIMVHSLIGVEELPGGDFMAPKAWQAETGTWMMPRMWELDQNSEYAKLNSQVLVGVDMDVDCILYAPWSAQRYEITWS
jgi:hypothetical protein